MSKLHLLWPRTRRGIEFDKSYLVRSNPVYVTHINSGLGHTKISSTFSSSFFWLFQFKTFLNLIHGHLLLCQEYMAINANIYHDSMI